MEDGGGVGAGLKMAPSPVVLLRRVNKAMTPVVLKARGLALQGVRRCPWDGDAGGMEFVEQSCEGPDRARPAASLGCGAASRAGTPPPRAPRPSRRPLSRPPDASSSNVSHTSRCDEDPFTRPLPVLSPRLRPFLCSWLPFAPPPSFETLAFPERHPVVTSEGLLFADSVLTSSGKRSDFLSPDSGCSSDIFFSFLFLEFELAV